MNKEIHNTPEFTPDFSSLAFLLGEIQSTKYYVRNYQRNMQNKANSLNVQIYINIYHTKDYQNFIPLAGYKNKPKTNPNKPNFRKAKMNVNLYVIEDYRKKDDFVVRINKPNFRNGQNERKLNFNKGLQKKRLFSSPKNKPKQTQFQTRLRSFSARSPWDCSIHKRLPRRGVYPERSRRGTRNYIFSSFPAKSGCPALKNVGTMNLLAVKSYKIYLNYLLLLSN